jgi:hypothetical protein
VKRMHEFNTRKLNKFFNGKNFLLLEKRGRMGSILFWDSSKINIKKICTYQTYIVISIPRNFIVHGFLS